MKTPSLVEINELLNAVDVAVLEESNVTILRNVMVETGAPYLQYGLLGLGSHGNIQFGEYDNVFQEAVGGAPQLLNDETDCVIVFMGMEALSWEMARNFNSLSPDSLAKEIDRVQKHIQSIMQGIRSQTSAMILWAGFESPLHPSYGILDAQNGDGQTGTYRLLNQFLREELDPIANAYFVDVDQCLARVGAERFYDLRYWHVGRAPYALDGLAIIMEEVLKFMRALKGKNKKCLVLDCDNTLWGGVVGEDGLSGIKLGASHPGSCYWEFQQEIMNLYGRGVILALCSKNNEEDVWEVFDNHPDMLLKRKHIATAQINWKDKAANLRQIALDLNIGLDSLVFVDDSDFEANLVRQEVPEVEVLHIPKVAAPKARSILAACGFFDTLAVSDEDRKRGEMYKAEVGRRELQAEITDMTSYYRSLDMHVYIHFADEFSAPRIAQQTQKTNQFNLTTCRYTDEDINRFMDDSDVDVVFLRLADRFGDSGIVGTCIVRYESDRGIIDTFLLSCRVLGRGVEKIFLSKILERIQSRGASLAVGEYVKTNKNSQVSDFYSHNGFVRVESAAGEGIVFHYNLVKNSPIGPEDYYEIESTI